MIWRIFQLAVIVSFGFANIYLEWGVDGLAAGVMGGMAAWFATELIAAVVDRVRHGTPILRKGESKLGQALARQAELDSQDKRDRDR